MSIYEYLQGKTLAEIAEAGYRLPDLDIEKAKSGCPELMRV